MLLGSGLQIFKNTLVVWIFDGPEAGYGSFDFNKMEADGEIEFG